MTVRGYVLVETSVGMTKDAINILRTTPGIKSVDAVTGPYDIVVIVEGEDLNAIGDLVTSKIHRVGGIARTVTCVSIPVA